MMPVESAIFIDTMVTYMAPRLNRSDGPFVYQGR